MSEKVKIVVLDGYAENPGDISWDKIESLGELTVYDRSTIEESKNRVKDAQIIITNKAKVTKEVIDAATNLKGIFMLATGFDPVDYKYAAEKGIGVYNIPSYGTDNVAELVFALMLELTKGVGVHDVSVKEGKWINSIDFTYFLVPQIELAGKTLGIVGYGTIGKRVSEIAKAFRMNVIALDHHGDKMGETNDVVKFVSMDEVLKESDFISLHTPLNDNTRGLINMDSFKKMKKTAMIINTARGAVIVEEDLRDALNNDIIAGAAIDVASKEPIEESNPILSARNIIITPHIAWGTKDARIRIMDTTFENIKKFLDGHEQNRVN